MKPQTVIVIGPQGSGKGTQAEKTRSFLETQTEPSVLHFEAGAAFRDLADRNTATGKQVKQAMQAGRLLPSFLATHLWTQCFLTKLEPDQHLLIDGSPRRLLEAKLLEEALEFYQRNNCFVFHLVIDEETAYQRLADRNRSDDSRAAITNRLKQYQEQTLPVIEYYQQQDRYQYVRVDGEQTIDVVQANIQQEITS